MVFSGSRVFRFGRKAHEPGRRFRLRLSDLRIATRIHLGFGAVILIGCAVVVSSVLQFGALGRQADRLAAASDTVASSLEVNRIAEAFRQRARQ